MAFFNRAGGELLGGGAVTDFNLFSRRSGVAGDVDLVSVDADMAVSDKLAGSRTGISETEAEDDVVEAGLENAEEVITSDAAHALGASEGQAELLLGQAVHHAKLLLLIEADAVFGDLAAGRLAVDTRRVRATLLTLGGGENILTEATIELRGGTGVTRHFGFLFVRSGGWIGPARFAIAGR